MTTSTYETCKKCGERFSNRKGTPNCTCRTMADPLDIAAARETINQGEWGTMHYLDQRQALDELETARARIATLERKLAAASKRSTS